MELHEKLQQLRKQNNMTQEQLAQLLYVSRTAISKWESGRGYPNLESLKSISKLFSVSIDELLSNDKLMELAQTENRTNINKMSHLAFGVLDVISLAFLFMPLFGLNDGTYIRGVALSDYTCISNLLRALYFISLTVIPVFGIIEILIGLNGSEKWLYFFKSCSIAVYAVVIVLFAISRQPYITAFLFLLFMVKVVLIIQENGIK